MARMATIGMFVLLLIACLHFSRGLLLPIMAALIIATALGPLMRSASSFGMPRWASALLLVVAITAVAAVGITFLAAPMTEWIARAPEIGAAVRQKLTVLDAPLAAFRDLQSSLSGGSNNNVKVESQLTELVMGAVAIFTPAVSQTVLFFVSLA